MLFQQTGLYDCSFRVNHIGTKVKPCFPGKGRNSLYSFFPQPFMLFF